MIRGYVNDRIEAIVPIQVFSESGKSKIVQTVVDTGYSGTLLLPEYLIEELELSSYGYSIGILADKSEVYINTYLAEIVWNNDRKVVTVSAMGDEALIGMGLLTGSALHIDVHSGGKVTIT